MKKIDVFSELRFLSYKDTVVRQKLVEKTSKSKDENANIGLMRDVLRMAVVGAEEMTDEEFDGFPLGELTTLSEKVMQTSGVSEVGAEAEGN